MKTVGKLCVMLNVRKGNAYVRKNRNVCLCKQSSLGMGIDVCVIINQISNRQLLVCVCNGSAPGSAKKRCAQRCMCVCTRESKGGYGCVYVRVCQFHSPIDRYLCVYVLCMLTPLKDCDYIRQLFYCKL